MKTKNCGDCLHMKLVPRKTEDIAYLFSLPVGRRTFPLWNDRASRCIKGNILKGDNNSRVFKNVLRTNMKERLLWETSAERCLDFVSMND